MFRWTQRFYLVKTEREGFKSFHAGKKREDNPYKKARLQFPTGFRDTSDNRLSALRDLECQWDSGYSIAQRTIE